MDKIAKNGQNYQQLEDNFIGLGLCYVYSNCIDIILKSY